MKPPTLPGEVWRGEWDGCTWAIDEAGEVHVWWPVSTWRGWDTCPASDSEITRALRRWALSLRADAQRAAEDMRERCASILEAAAKVRDAGAEHAKTTRNEYLLTVSKAEADALRHVEAQIRALPIPANATTPEVLCVPGCVRREAEGAGHSGACREKP